MEILQNIHKLQDILEARSEVSSTLSLSDYVGYMYYRMRGKKQEFFKIPENRLFLSRMFRMLDNNDDPRAQSIYAYSDREFRRTKISVRLSDSNTIAMKKLLDDIQPELEKLFDDEIFIGYSGDYLRLRNGKVIVESQIFSLSVTLLITVLR